MVIFIIQQASSPGSASQVLLQAHEFMEVIRDSLKRVTSQVLPARADLFFTEIESLCRVRDKREKDTSARFIEHC